MKFFLLFSLIVLNMVTCGKGLTQTGPTPIIQAELAQDSIIQPIDQHQHGFHMPYTLEEPRQRFELPSRLKEISGLSITENDSLLCANQDEEGVLFYINKYNGTVEKEIPFYKNGDYESIEVVGDKVFVAKSTGTIYEVKNLDTIPPFVQKHKFFLSKDNDVEGLCYDPLNNRLLLACKGLPATGESFELAKFKKVVYSFDLETNSMNINPTYVISLEAIQNYLKHCKASPFHENFVVTLLPLQMP